MKQGDGREQNNIPKQIVALHTTKAVSGDLHPTRQTAAIQVVVLVTGSIEPSASGQTRRQVGDRVRSADRHELVRFALTIRTARAQL